MHYRQTTDESVCCQIFPGILPWENNNKFDINNDSFWLENPNPWQIIFDGYKKGIKPGKQVGGLHHSAGLSGYLQNPCDGSSSTGTTLSRKKAAIVEGWSGFPCSYATRN